MIMLEKFQGYPHIPKVWGQEIVLVNSPKYCAKFLVIAPGKQCSLHRHLIKDETFYILEGEVLIDYGEPPCHNELKYQGDCFHVATGMWHRFGSLEGAIILEVSSEHNDEDVERLQPSGDLLPF